MFQGLKRIILTIALVLLLCQQITYAEKTAIAIQTEDDFPPFRFVENGSLIGFDIDFSRMIFEKGDYKVDFTTDSWDKVYKRLMNGEIDSCGLLANTGTRGKYMDFTKPVYTANYGVYSKYTGKLDIKKLGKYKIGLSKDHNAELLMQNKLGIKNYKTFPDVEAAVDALNKGEIDVVFENQLVVEYFLIMKGLKSRINENNSDLFPTDLAFGVKKGDTALVEFMNKRISELQKSGAYEQLYQHYFREHSEYYNKERQKKIILTIAAILAAVVLIFLLLQIYIRYLKNRLIEDRNLVDKVFDSANIIMLIWKMDGTIVRFNRFAETIMGYAESEVVGKRWQEVLIPERIRGYMTAMHERIIKGEVAQNHENKLLCKDGREIDILWNNSLLYTKRNVPRFVLSMGVDITKRNEAESKLAESYKILGLANEELAAAEEGLKKQYEELEKSQNSLRISEERYRLAVDGSNDGVWDWDIETDKVFTSERWNKMLGFGENETHDGFESIIEMVHPEDRGIFRQANNDYIEGRIPTYEAEVRMKSKNGEYKWILTRGKAIWDKNGKPTRMAGSHTDITERKHSEEKINYMAYYDLLTGLPNRTLLLNRFNIELARARRYDHMMALLFMDLDNFKNVNDTFGHTFGDEILKIVGGKIRDCIRECDTVARFGADEYIILLSRVYEASDVTRIAARIIEKFREPVILDDRKFYITTSIGISVYPNDGADVQTLLRNSDTAMYRAKEMGKNNYQMYTQSMNLKVAEKLEIESSLRHAIENGEFVVYYQPQINIESGRIEGTEALIRWIHPQNGLVPPMKFIPTAEESGLIVPIGEWVLKTACARNKAWQDEGYTPQSVAVNLSARQFQQQDLVEMISRVLEETGLEPKWLEIEITESLAMKDIELTINVLARLREMGITVSLDDFGTGYSSLNYLKRLPINNLKIDKSFVHDITEGSREEAIAKAVISIAHSMNLSVTAEGVETEQQLAFLKQHGCDKVQGFLFSRPVSANELEDLLEKTEFYNIKSIIEG